MDNRSRIALLEDHPVFRCGLKAILPSRYEVVIEADTAASFFKQLKTAQVDLVVLDLLLPDMSGIEVARFLKSTLPEIRILVLSVDTREESIRELVKMGVEGFLCKTSSEAKLCEAMGGIFDGQTFFERSEETLERDVLISIHEQVASQLTKREADILLLLCRGMTCNEISRQLFISPKTVDNHKQHIFSKLDIHNLVELVIYAIQHKIITI